MIEVLIIDESQFFFRIFDKRKIIAQGISSGKPEYNPNKKIFKTSNFTFSNVDLAYYETTDKGLVDEIQKMCEE